ncbi:C39 family peptidase [Nicoliella spurrieriana]|uniref:C39 family peptidase n=1 Tax=Nicoliella spurrieriana TaxID=2925830 RepID=A0A976RS49_9LACO|nr:C39 family peptidase [Nicoliella spurrieriana]UQS86853.1 C39 family peptidase [Nicoliella spurrieriana]
MKSTTIASEKTHAFYVKLKRSPRAYWFVPELEHQVKVRKIKIPKQVARGEFMVTRFGYFNKHAWYFFNNDPVSGWLPLKGVRDNYRRLAVNAEKQRTDDLQGSYVTSALMMLEYVGNELPLTRLRTLLSDNTNGFPMPADFFTIFVEHVGSFKNLSNKKLRRIRNQLRRERPVMMWVKNLSEQNAFAIVLTGFSKKRFFYINPITGQVNIIDKKQLLKMWKAAGYLAISY